MVGGRERWGKIERGREEGEGEGGRGRGGGGGEGEVIVGAPVEAGP
jgi:hypothetical protein